MPPRRANSRNANARNANAAPPVLDQGVSNIEFRNALQNFGLEYNQPEQLGSCSWECKW